MLVKGLPPEGTAVDRAMHGEAAQVSTGDHLLARLVNAVEGLSWGYYAVHRDPKKDRAPAPRPKPVELPRRPQPPTRSTPPRDDGARYTPKGKRIANNAETLAILRGALG